MNFDMVFDIQHAYRQVVHAFAYPGEIVSLKQEADRLELGCHAGLLPVYCCICCWMRIPAFMLWRRNS